MTNLSLSNYKKYLATALFAITFFISSSLSAAEVKAGIVILAKGEFFAINKNNEKRLLKRRSPVFPGDTLETGDDSVSQIRFIDNAVISLRPNTSLRIDEYAMSDNADKTNESSVISLLKGGFRTITGAINKNNYTVNSEIASIGVRGTTYEVVLGNSMYVGTWQGGVSVRTNGGNLELGKGAAYNFAQISGSSFKPTGLLFPPKILTPTNSPIFNTVGQKAPGEYRNRPINPVAFHGTKSVFNIITQKANTLILTPTDLTTGTNSTQLPGATKSKDISNVKLDRLGLLVISGVNKTKFFGGRASSDATGKPVITDNGYGPHELPMFINTTPNVAFWNNGATSVVNTASIPGSSQKIYYGQWDTSGQSKPIMQVDPLGAAAEIEINSPAYWITALPTLPLVINNKTGSLSYDTLLSLDGNTSGGTLSSSTQGSIGLTVNFDTNLISGNLSFTVASDTWSVDLQGAVKQNVLDVKVIETSSNMNAQPIKGQVPMIFTGETGKGVVGLFDLEQISDPSIHAEGVFSAEASGG